LGNDNRSEYEHGFRPFLELESQERSKSKKRYVYKRIERGIRKRSRVDGKGEVAFEVALTQDGRGTTRTARSLSEARTVRDRNNGLRAMGERIVRDDPRLRVDQFIERDWLRWLAQEVAMGNLRESTAVWYRYGARNLVKDLGRFRVSQIDRQLLRNFMARRIEAGDSKAKLHQARTTLRSIVSLAIEHGVLVTDPTAFLVGRNAPKAVKQPKPKVKAWGKADAKAFLDAVEGDELEVLWHLYVSTGLRRGEAIGLQWDDLDLSAGTLSVRRTLSNVGNQPVFQEPKTESSKRTIAIGESMVSRLREYKRHQAESKLAASEWLNDRDLVFTTTEGRPLRPEAVTRRLRRIVERAGLEWIGVHGLRHTMASLALQAGTDIATVSQRLGHSNTQITAQVYLHGSAETDRFAAQALDGLFSSPGAV